MNEIPTQDIFRVLSELEGDVGLFIADEATGEIFTVNGDKLFVACSLIKVPILAMLLKSAEAGEINLKEKISIPIDKMVGGTGIIYNLSPGIKFSWEDLMVLMITLSDNNATNAIIDRLGSDKINSFFAETGLLHTTLKRKMLDMDAIAEGRNNYTTASDMGNLLFSMAKGEFVNPDISESVLNVMRKQIYTCKLPAAIPAVPSYATLEEKRSPMPGKVSVANKTGELSMTQHDIGVFQLASGRRYVIAMLTANLKSDYDGITAIAHVSRIVYDALCN